jgi:hypothetical protein
VHLPPEILIPGGRNTSGCGRRQRVADSGLVPVQPTLSRHSARFKAAVQSIVTVRKSVKLADE